MAEGQKRGGRKQAPKGAPDGTAYVICPIGPAKSEIRVRADEIMEFVIGPAAAQVGLQTDRSDREPAPGNITRQIVKAITEARVVIADLSSRNPNVFYELGVAHSFQRPVVLLIDDASKMPFDVHHERVIELGSEGRISLTDAKRAGGELIEALKVVVAEGYKPASIVTDVARAQDMTDLESDDPRGAQLETINAQLEYLSTQVRSLESRVERSAGASGVLSSPDWYKPISPIGPSLLSGVMSGSLGALDALKPPSVVITSGTTEIEGTPRVTITNVPTKPPNRRQ
jgi:nucleoside 2-deoxyribosyltransferase